MDLSVLKFNTLLRVLFKYGDTFINVVTLRCGVLSNLVSQCVAYKQERVPLTIGFLGCSIQQPDVKDKAAFL